MTSLAFFLVAVGLGWNAIRSFSAFIGLLALLYLVCTGVI